MFHPKANPEGFIGILVLIGAGIGLGKLLASDEKLTVRLIIGRAVVTGGIGAAAGAITLMFPTADQVVHYGMAAALASLGTSGLETIMNRWGNRQ